MSYNINELLEEKKELEDQIIEFGRGVSTEKLTHKLVTTTDHTKDVEPIVYEPQPVVTLDNYLEGFNTMVKRLADIKGAIQDYNAKNILGKLQTREQLRSKIDVLTNIEGTLPINGDKETQPIRGRDNILIQSVVTETKPMFNKKEVRKQLNELSAQQRKINTEIQKENLNAKIDL